ncbi:hypothetical protein ACVU7I_19290 [Patulibacter sp. S7RM1-6]
MCPVGAAGGRPSSPRARIPGAMDDWSLFISFIVGALVLAYGINLAAGAV